MIALVDCNNFYVSCERLFNPKLEKRPVIVLSNNDGCAVSRSEEAKAIGIEMGTPAFMIQDLIKKHNVVLFSSNYTLYGDLSNRVMKILASFVPQMEIYSIDEAFLDMRDMEQIGLLKTAISIRKNVKQLVGIPVCVGIAPTKTLAKMANRYAKKVYPEIGCFYAANDDLINEMLRYTQVQDIWGIGRQYALLLNRSGFKTAYDVKNAPEEWIRKNMTVQGQRLLNELRGIPSKEWEFQQKAKKNICTSRSFGKLLADKTIIKEALCNYAASCALKLRDQKSCAKAVLISLQTNPHKIEDNQYFSSIKVQFETASNDTPAIIKYALKGFEIIFKPGYNYMKCSVTVIDLVPENQTQISLFSGVPNIKKNRVTDALDKVNKSFGKDIVRYAVQGYEKKYRLRADHLSKRYTTNINEILEVKY